MTVSDVAQIWNTGPDDCLLVGGMISQKMHFVKIYISIADGMYTLAA